MLDVETAKSEVIENPVKEDIAKTPEVEIRVAEQNDGTLLVSERSEIHLSNNIDQEFFQLSEIPSIRKNGPQIVNTTAQIKPDLHFIQVNETDLALPGNENGIKKAYDFALRVKNGEEDLIDLRKAKEDLFAMAKNIKFKQSESD